MPCRWSGSDLDATTSCGYHTVTDDGLMQLGHSKDHRPDLAQFKLMAAVAEPTGLFLAGDVHPGNAADDPLYLPLYRRVRTLLGQTGLLYSGDCKMAALETRAEVAANQDFYLTRLPLTGTVPAEFAAWVEAAVVGEQATKLIEIRRDEELIGRGYEFERPQSVVVGQDEHTWTERVQIIRSEASAQSQAAALERRMEKAEAAVRGLTPPPGPRRTQLSTGCGVGTGGQGGARPSRAWETGLMTVTWERQETSRDPPTWARAEEAVRNRPQTTEWERALIEITTVDAGDDAAIERLVARMGWQVQVTNVASSRLSLGDCVLCYRAGTCVERAFHQLKDQPLGIRPLYVHRDDQVRGLTHLLTLALRVLTLFEVPGFAEGRIRAARDLGGFVSEVKRSGRRIGRRRSGC